MKKALDAAAQDADLKTYDIFQPSYAGKGTFVVGQIDARDQTDYKKALELIGATSSDFKFTFPLALISKRGDGFILSQKQFASNNKLSPALQ